MPRGFHDSADSDGYSAILSLGRCIAVGEWSVELKPWLKIVHGGRPDALYLLQIAGVSEGRPPPRPFMDSVAMGDNGPRAGRTDAGQSGQAGRRSVVRIDSLARGDRRGTCRAVVHPGGKTQCKGKAGPHARDETEGLGCPYGRTAFDQAGIRRCACHGTPSERSAGLYRLNMDAYKRWSVLNDSLGSNSSVSRPLWAISPAPSARLPWFTAST